jgi:glutathione peroxidase
VSFPMYAKIDVNGQNAHALYKHLTAQKRGADGAEDIKWNFAKFLVGPDGEVIRRYEPAEAPEVIGKDLEALLK